MDQEYLFLEQDDTNSDYYLAMTASGALYYGAVNSELELVTDWKLININRDDVGSIH